MAALEALIYFGVQSQASFQPVLSLLVNGALGQIVLLLVAALLGATAVIVFERLYAWVRLNIGSLWALIASLVLVMVVRSLFQGFIPMLLTGNSFTYAMGMAIGTFWKGKPYW